MARLIADISDFQRPADPNAYKAVGITGIIAKVTESTNFKTRTHPHNLIAARDAGMVVGGYHFLHKGDPGQADFYVDTVSRAWGGVDGMFHMLDVELEAGGKAPLINDVHDFATRFSQLTNGHPLLIYSGSWYWRGYMGNPQETHDAALVDASYISGTGDPRELVKKVTMGYWRPYGGWGSPLIRQFTSTAVVPGEPFPVDCNVLYGTEDELKKMMRGGSQPPPPWTKFKTVRLGDGMPPAGPDGTVKYLQQCLNVLKAHPQLEPDGRFGQATEGAVKSFQGFLKTADATIAVDGVCGPVTWRGVYYFMSLVGVPEHVEEVRGTPRPALD